MLTQTPTHDATPSAETVASVIRDALHQHREQQGSLLPILHTVQDALGCIPAQAVPLLSDALQRSRAEIHGVVRFYPHFREAPAAAVVLEVCRAEACQAMGGSQLAEHARKTLGCDFHETSRSGATTLQPVYCLGLCAQSPAIMINGVPHARMTPIRLDELLLEAEAMT